MDQNELNKILENHKHWINKDCEGWKNMKANLYRADLYELDLHRIDLKVNLHGADLCRADFHGSDLRGSDLCGANLLGANLSGAALCKVNLYGADLCGANLYGADLCGANLRGANLYRADLYGANLYGVDLRGANLYEADLRGAVNIPFIPYYCPEYGKFIGYKKAGEYVIELEIPEDAKRVSGTTRKCRCDKAKVLRILNKDREIVDVDDVASNYDKSFIYKVGEIVSVDNFDEDRWDECSTGIHFFISFQEAVNYSN